MPLPADDERGIDAAFGEHARDQARRRGLAVRAGDCDAIAKPHELGEHLGALHDRDAPCVSGLNLGVVRGNGARYDDHVRRREIVHAVALEYLGTQRGQSIRHGGGLEIRAPHLIAQIE